MYMIRIPSGKYPYIIKSRNANWVNLSTLLEIRKTIYTTNLIENINRGIRKYPVYPSLMQARKKWSTRLSDTVVTSMHSVTTIVILEIIPLFHHPHLPQHLHRYLLPALPKIRIRHTSLFHQPCRKKINILPALNIPDPPSRILTMIPCPSCLCP